MPNCFTLTRKSDLEAGPVPFITIDNEMCAHFGVEPHEKFYFCDWYNTIGFRIALGRKLEDMATIYEDEATDPKNTALTSDAIKWYESIIKIAEYLSERFTSDAWAEIGKR